MMGFGEAQALLDKVLEEPCRMLIGGEWREARSGATRTVFGPSDGRPLAEVPDAAPEDVDEAVGAATRALHEGPWVRASASDRGRLLLRVTALIERHAEELAVLESANNGKPIRESREIDVRLAADCFEYFAGFATKLTGRTLPVPGNALSYTVREPLGVIAAITPFNFPLMLAAWKIAPALAFGNTVIIKPSEETPLSTIRLIELCQEAGAPRGVINLVTGGPAVGTALVDHAQIAKVSFTGSTRVGRQIASTAGANLKRVTLELGGKAPNIVFDDAELDDAVAGALFGVFWTQGEICTAGSRLLIQRSILADFTERFVSRVKRLRVGHSLDETTQIGPLVSPGQRDTVLGYIDSARRAGARVLVGGQVPDDPKLGQGNFVIPTVIDNVTGDMPIVREEIFGPVVVLLPFDTEEEAVSIANDTSYGLSAGVWTQNVRRAHLMARKLHAGTVWVNAYNVIATEAPFGGMKDSGWGRENGFEAADEYTEVKHVYIGLDERSLDWFGD